MIVALVGYRGCGKTTIGKRLADRLWRTFADVDELVVKKAEKPIAQIFAEEGEERFRDLETEALAEALKIEDVVLGLGGGTLGREQNLAMLREAGARVIYLRCEPAELLRRVEADPASPLNRPALTATGGMEEIRLKLAEREPVYREAMHAELDVTRMSPEEAVAYIARFA
jgi:shikimate kinase